MNKTIDDLAYDCDGSHDDTVRVLNEAAEIARREERARICALLANRAALFRKYETFMGGADEGMQPHEIAAKACDYVRGILEAPEARRTTGQFSPKAT